MTPLAFRPFPLIKRPHLQTIVAATLGLRLGPPSAARLLDLPGGDRLVLEVSTPPSWRPPDGTVVLVHGLCGCGRSAYLLRMARKLYRRGVRAVRVNLRGSGAGKGLAREPYHSGRSEDLLAVLRALAREEPPSPAALLGYSLGGNMALKLAGELGSDARGLLERVIAVCPPVDLLSSSRRMGFPANRLYERYFIRHLRRDVVARQAAFPDLAPVALPRRLTLFEFDELYTAPRCGFQGALDYYRRASALPLLPRVTVPCRILLAEDDPLIDFRTLEAMELPPCVRVVRTARGGHLGFLGLPGAPGGIRWMDSQLLRWLEEPGEGTGGAA